MMVNNPSGAGERNGRWAGGRRLVPSGYVYLYAPDHPYATTSGAVLEHRLVMESRLGRYLMPNETVHHLNGVKDDNRDENLELWVKSQPSGQRARDLVAWAREIIDLYADVR